MEVGWGWKGGDLEGSQVGAIWNMEIHGNLS